MDICEKSLRYLKTLTAETISNAKSGHTGSALGASSILFALYKDHLLFDTSNKPALIRDRLVMSAGHASGLLYSLIHLFGYDLSISDLKEFRKYGSKTPGHPEYGVVPGVETSTGPLGQGVANAVGLAIAEKMLNAKFGGKKPLIDNYTYCYAGDGCLMEGVGVEACSLAGTLKLNKLILLYDNNNITIDGTVDIANRENIAKKFSAMGWEVIKENNGNNVAACSKAIEKAKNSDKPVIIIFKTTIGIGTKAEGTNKAHAMPLSAEYLAEFKQKLEINESFYIPEDVYKYCRATTEKNNKVIAKWNDRIKELKTKNPEKYKEFNDFFKTKSINFAKTLSVLEAKGEISGRDASHVVLNELAKVLPKFVGGTADLAPSTKAYIDDGGDFSAENPLGKNLHFGIREHAMGAISNGIALFAKTPVFNSTFLAFSNYMIPPIRMSAMMQLPVLSIFSHDSIEVGQDGPTHQPIEQLGALRSIIGLTVYRPGTIQEMVAAYKVFIESGKPMAIAATKSKLPSFYHSTIYGAERGGYIIYESRKKSTIQIIATGKELELAVSVAKSLDDKGVRVISMPCESIFACQDEAYKKSVLLKTPSLSVAIEASNDNIWYKYVGNTGLVIGVNEYKKSGTGEEVYKQAGFDKDMILKKLKTYIK